MPCYAKFDLMSVPFQFGEMFAGWGANLRERPANLRNNLEILYSLRMSQGTVGTLKIEPRLSCPSATEIRLNLRYFLGLRHFVD